MHSSSIQPAPKANPSFGKPIVFLLILALIGLVAAAGHASISPDGVRRFMFAYLTGFACVLSLLVASLFFVMVNHLSNAGWSVLIRRIPETIIANAWVVILLSLPIVFTVVQGKGVLYYWAQPDDKVLVHHYDPYNTHAAHDDAHGHGDAHGAHASSGHGEVVSGQPVQAHANESQAHADAHPGDHHSSEQDKVILGKRAYLNVPFFLIRWIVVFGLFAFLGWYFWSRSIQQDTNGDYKITQKLNLVAAPGLFLFGVATTVIAFDFFMSLEAHWFSTIFGVYYFAGSVLFNFCVMTLLLVWLQKTGRLTPSINTEHYHDLGKFTFGFVFFWSYIAFSQYMLYWYANMPETTFWFHMRGASSQEHGANPWTPIAILILLGHFALPFAGLLSRHVKRNRKLLVGWAIWLCIMHWVDMVWVVMPSLSQGTRLDIGLTEVGLSVALLSIFLAAFFYRLGKHSLVPVGDPRLNESLAHQNM